MRKKIFYLYIITFFSGMIPYIILPYISRQLTVDEFGVFNLFQYSVYFLLPFLTLGYQTGIRKYFANKVNYLISRNLFKMIFELMIKQIFIIIVLIFIIKVLGFLRTFNYVDILLVVIACMWIGIYSFITIYWDLKELYVYKSVYNFIINLFLYISVIIFLNLGFAEYSRIMSLLIIYPVFIFLAILFIKKTVKLIHKNINIKHKDFLYTGFPLAFFSILDLLVVNSDKWSILYFYSSYDLGLYSAYFYFYIFMLFFIKPLSSMIEVKVYKNDDMAIKIKRIIIILSFIFLFILVFFHKKIVYIIFGIKYVEDAYIIIILYIASIFRMLISFQQINLIVYNKQKETLLFSVLVTIISIIFIVLLTMYYKIIGTAFGILIYNILLYLLLTSKLKYKILF